MRLTSLGALGVGFVLGARAGRERYEQIRVVAQQAGQRLEAYGAGGTLARRLRSQSIGSRTPAGRG